MYMFEKYVQIINFTGKPLKIQRTAKANKNCKTK